MSFKKLLLAAAVVMSFVSAAHATTVTVSTSLNQLQKGVDNQGWWSNFSTNGNSKNDNYYIANGYRDFFSFDLSGISGNVTSATFQVRRYGQSGNVLLDLWDVTTPATSLITTRQGISNQAIYNDLGSGISYGEFTVTNGASQDILNFSLNAAALADINKKIGQGYFSIGGSLNGAGNLFSNSSSEPGNSGGSANSIQQLVLGIGLVGLASRRRKARKV